ncbi:MAG: phosphoribosyl-AMP cyclohydrolase [Candidatus Pacebacteria bacterium]|nr:phosphoribosyl-AMP cyclohydrolase [Candidatus Paceibacterota bacterium]
MPTGLKEILIPDFRQRPDRPFETIPAIVQIEGNGIVIDLVYLNRNRFFGMLRTGTLKVCERKLLVSGVAINCEGNSLLVSVVKPSADELMPLCCVERDELFPAKNEPKFADGKEIRPVIVMRGFPQGKALMVGSTNKRAFDLMLECRQLVLWSVTRSKIWHKGAEESGNYIPIQNIYTNATGSVLIYVTHSEVPICHVNALGCYSRSILTGTRLLIEVPEEKLSGLRVPQKGVAKVSGRIAS